MLHNPHPLLKYALPLLLMTQIAQAKTVHGVRLPSRCKQLEANQCRSPFPFSATIRWLEKSLRKRGHKVQFRRIVDLPDVIVAHAETQKSQSLWVGINVAQYDGSVKIFIIPRQ